MSRRCLEGVSRVFGSCLESVEGVKKVTGWSGRCLEPVRRVSGVCLEVVWEASGRVSGTCLEVDLRVSRWCLEDVWKVSVRGILDNCFIKMFYIFFLLFLHF